MNEEYLPFYWYVGWFLLTRITLFALLVHDERKYPGSLAKLMANEENSAMLSFLWVPVVPELLLALILVVFVAIGTPAGIWWCVIHGIMWLVLRLAHGASKNEAD